VAFVDVLQRGAWLPIETLNRLTAVQRLAVLWVAGAIALALATTVCFQLSLNFATTAFVFLIVVVLLCLLDSFVSSAIFSAVAIGLLNFFFVEPRFTFQVGEAQDVTTLVAFLVTSLAVTSLIRRVRALGVAQGEQARLLDLTADAIFVRDIDNVITYWNRGAEQLYGWTRSEAIGKVSHDMLQTVFPAPRAEIEAVLSRAGHWEGELLHTTRAGATVSVASRWSRQQDERGLAIGTLESNTDITERKRAEDALRRSQAAYLAEAQRLSHTGSFGWNVSSGEIFWSEETFRIYGYPTTTQPSIETILQRVHPDDRALVRETINGSGDGKQDLDFEHRLLMPDGSVKHLHVVAHAAANGSSHHQFFGAVSNITAHKEAYGALERSEQRYRDVFDYMPIGLTQIDASGLVALFRELHVQGVTDLKAYIDEHPDFVWRATDALIVEAVNEHTVRMFGAKGAAEMVGPATRYWRASPDTMRRNLEARFRGEEFFQEETKMTTVDGRAIDAVFAAARLGALADRSLVGFVEITDRVRAQEMLSRVQADFAHAARVSMLGELTASIAHEVNQPLAAIAASGQAGLRWLGRPAPDLAEVRELTTRIVADAGRAADIIARVRSMAARKVPEQALCSLDDVIREALLFLRHEVQSRAVGIAHHPAPTAPQVLGDRTQLQQVIVNLAMNSMQAMADVGHPTRKIIVRTTVPYPGTVHCSVEDSGPGISPRHLPRLFESFFTTKEGGMGMGLPICRSIIEAHGGRITADNDSAEGGARFSFTLPAAARSEV
jgi:PAS domain S-box-containing protein